MKKKLAYLFIAICVVVLALYGYRYKRTLIIENKIPTAATEIVQINLRLIEQHLLIDAIMNPFKYISFKAHNETHTSLKKAIIVPRNLLFFTNTSSFRDAWFSNFIKLTDGIELKNYLLQEGFEELKDKELKLFSKDHFVIAVSGEKVLIAYKKQQHASLNTVIKTIFKETNFYKKDIDLIKSISNSKSDITYTNLYTDFLEADFKKGLFEIRGKLHTNLFVTDRYSKQSENSIGFITTKINKGHYIFRSFMSDKNKTKFNEFTKLSLDSIVDNWNGSAAFNLKSIDKKIDTIITYDYDDDFNKIEKKSVQELNLPNATFALGSNTNLYKYLYNNESVQIIEKDTLFTSIPLYKMYTRKQDSSLNIYTKKPFNTPLLKEKEYKLNAHINIDRYLQSQLEFSLISIKNKNLQLSRNISAKLEKNDELLIQVRLKEESRNFLGKLMKP